MYDLSAHPLLVPLGVSMLFLLHSFCRILIEQAALYYDKGDFAKGDDQA